MKQSHIAPQRGLASAHPIVAAAYFLSVLPITMFAAHPVLLASALFGAVLALAGYPGGLRGSGLYLLLFGVVALSNPLFSHHGVTPLFFIGGNPVTLEALLYGVDLAAMLVAALLWFACLNRVLTEDKLLYLLGRISPKTALVLSSALRFVPLLRSQAARIRQTQTALGLFACESWMDKLRALLRVWSALITWALEQAMDTGASMKARGYGLRGRSHYALFRFRRADALLLGVIALLDGIVIAALAGGWLGFAFYPAIRVAPLTGMGVAGAVAYGVLCFLPVILAAKEAILWTCSRSTI